MKKLLIITRAQEEFHEGITNLNLDWLEVHAPLEEEWIQKLLPEADIILC